MTSFEDYIGSRSTRLTIVGNGFDLAIGAKTKYEDFYECLRVCLDSKSLEEFKNHYPNSDERLSDLFYSTVERNRDNFFINYFINYASVFGNWVEFEKELTKIVKSFDNLISYLNSSDRLLVHATSTGSVKSYVRLFDDMTLLQVLSVYKDNKFFFTDLSQYNFRDKGYILFNLNGKRCNSIYAFYNRVESFSQDFPKELFKDLTVFSNLFSIYLGIVDHYAQLNRKLKDITAISIFINYNFTDYLEKITGANTSDSKRIININGVFKNADNTSVQNIVFGIDSNTQLRNSQFEVFTKRIQRSIKGTDINCLGQLLNGRINEIKVIGHSLSLADYESLGFIFSKADKNRPRIIIYYFDEDGKIDLIINLKQILGRDVFDDYQRQGLLKFVNSKEAWEK